MSLPQAKSTASPAQPLATAYFWLVAIVGTLAGVWVMVTDAGFVGLVEVLTHGGGVADATRGTLIANPTFYLLLGLGLVAEMTHIPLPKGGRMSAGFLVAFAAMLMLGLNAAIGVVIFVNIVTGLMPPRREPVFALFNIGQLALAYIAANYALTYGHVYIYGYPGPDDNNFVALATLAYLVVTFLVVDGYLALKKGISPWRILWEDDRTEIFVTVALAPMALMMAYMYKEQGWWGAGLVLIPMFATAYGVRLYIQVKKSEQALAEFNQQLTILQQVATRISSQIDLDQTLTLITQEMRRVVGYHDCMIFLLDPSSNLLVRQATSDPLMPKAPLKLPLEHGLIGEVATEKRAALVADLAAESLDVGVLAGHRSLLAVPVTTDQELLGVIALLHRSPDAFDEGDERLLKILASQAAVAIKNAQLYRATQQLAVTDGLTKIYNRRYFEEQLASELARGRRHKHTTSLVILDVDHFKKFNDTHGHLLGDQVLQGVARVLQKSTRETDLVARYGGEEFVVILPETPAEAAIEVAERIRRNIKAHPFWGRGQTPLQVTASVGLVSDPLSLLEPKPLIDQADKCLYQAKHEGRDRVCRVVYSPDQPVAITTSRQEAAPEPTLRRQMRAVSSISTSDWDRYLTGNLDAAFEAYWNDPRVREALGDAHDFWRRLAGEFVAVLLKKLSSTEEERNGWLERFARFPIYREVQAELSRLIQDGVTITQMEHAILAFYKRTQALIQGAPFSLEERMTVGMIQERLFHVLQLMVAQVWHDFYQATSEHLTLVAELESRLGASFDPDAVLAEIAHLTARAMGGDACLVLLPETTSKDLVVQGSWGLADVDSGWSVPIGGSLSGHCFVYQEVCLVGDVHADPRVHQAFHQRLEATRPARSAIMLPLVHEDVSLGVLYCLSEHLDHFTPLDVRLGKGIGSRLAAALARHRQETERQVRYLDSVAALAEALEARARQRGGPSRLTALAGELAAASGLQPSQIEQIQEAVRLHDIGEIGIPDAVFEKAAPLSPEERELVRSHPVVGARILGYVEALREIVPIVRHHHERMDGSGYPDGLRGDEIPIMARILAVADAFEAMTSERPYRQAMTPEQALNELRRSQHFDPALIDRLEALVRDRDAAAAEA
jgi:diguanylate cyclase